MTRQKIRKNIEEPDYTVSQQYLIYIDKTLHPLMRNWYFFQALFTKTNHIMGHKTHFNKFFRIEIMQNVFFDHSGIM